MSVAQELASRVRLSDPRPSHCSACFRGADDGVVFVDFDSAIDRGQMVETREGVVLHRDSIDDLHLCESCVRVGAEVLGLKPELHSRQFREIKRLELENEHWRDYAKRLEQTLEARPEPAPRARRRVA